MKKLLWGIIFVVLAVVVVGFFLPGSAHVERSMVINATPDEIYPFVSDFNRLNEWSPWVRKDPNTQFKMDRTTGVGARMEWHSEHPDVGSGSQEFLELRPGEYVKVALDFGAMGQATAFHQLDPDPGGTRVTWGFDSEFGYNLMFRYVGMMLDQWVGPDYEQGLANLKDLVENQSAEADS